MKRLIRRSNVMNSVKYSELMRRIYGADEDEGEAEGGEDNYENVSEDVVEAFNQLIEKLRKTSFNQLPEELDKVIQDPKLFKLFSKGFGKGNLADVKMTKETTAIPVKELHPTQNIIGADKSLNRSLGGDCSHFFKGTVKLGAPIVSYQETYVIDGHHRWSQVYMINPNGAIESIDFDSKQDAKQVLRNFQGAIAKAAGDAGKSEIPKAGGGDPAQNLLAMSKEAIKQYVTERISDACWKSIVKATDCTDKESVIDYITNNALEMQKANTNYSSNPPRKSMPQTVSDELGDTPLEIADEGVTNI